MIKFAIAAYAALACVMTLIAFARFWRRTQGLEERQHATDAMVAALAQASAAGRFPLNARRDNHREFVSAVLTCFLQTPRGATALEEAPDLLAGMPIWHAPEGDGQTVLKHFLEALEALTPETLGYHDQSVHDVVTLGLAVANVSPPASRDKVYRLAAKLAVGTNLIALALRDPYNEEEQHMARDRSSVGAEVGAPVQVIHSLALTSVEPKRLALVGLVKPPPSAEINARISAHWRAGLGARLVAVLGIATFLGGAIFAGQLREEERLAKHERASAALKDLLEDLRVVSAGVPRGADADLPRAVREYTVRGSLSALPKAEREPLTASPKAEREPLTASPNTERPRTALGKALERRIKLSNGMEVLLDTLYAETTGDWRPVYFQRARKLPSLGAHERPSIEIPRESLEEAEELVIALEGASGAETYWSAKADVARDGNQKVVVTYSHTPAALALLAKLLQGTPGEARMLNDLALFMRTKSVEQAIGLHTWLQRNKSQQSPPSK